MSSAGQYGIMIPGETCFKFTNGRPKNNNRRKLTHYLTDRKSNDEIMSDENEDCNEEYGERIDEEKNEQQRQNEQEISKIEDEQQQQQQQQEILCPASSSAGKKTKGRVKIKMEFIDNKLRRYTTFSKRKTGIMKKAYELSTLTGTQVMLLVASETGHVYTFATKKLQPMITSDTGKALIQGCLNTPDADSILASTSNNQQEIEDRSSTTVANQNESSPINLTNQKRKDHVIRNFGANSRKRFKNYHNNNNGDDQVHKVEKQEHQQSSTYIFPSKLGDLPTMVAPNASMLFSLADSLINYNNDDNNNGGEKTIGGGGAGDRPSSSSSSTPESCFSSSSTNNDRLFKSENIPGSDLAEVNSCNGNLPKRRSTTKNRNLDSATTATAMENNQNALISTFLQSMIMNSAAVAATMKNQQNDKNVNNEEINKNKNQNVSVSSPIFPFANFFSSTLTASGQGQAQGFGFLPAGLAANGSLMYQMPQNLLYQAAGEENGAGEAPQQQYITIPFPVPFNQTMLASQLLNNLVNNNVDNQSQLKKSPMTLEDE